MNKLPLRRQVFSRVTCVLVYGCAGFTVLLLAAMIGYILYRGLPHITWELLFTSPSALKDTYGILPNILNTLYIICMTLLLALPVGVGAAVYLGEYCRWRPLVTGIEFATEILAGIPSILYGLVGMLVFRGAMGLGTSLLSGALTLSIMVLPTIIRTTQEALKTVPQSFREGAAGLGATKWYLLRTIVLPSSMDGIVGGAILSIGRIVGESAALLFTAGLSHVVADNVLAALTQSGATLSVALYVYVQERGKFDLGFAIAAILMLIVIVINLTTKLVQKKLKRV